MRDVQAASKLQPHLGSDEIILWAGHPGRGLRFRASDAFAVPFSVFWIAFCAFFEYNAVKDGWLSFHAIWGVPFIIVGLYIAVGRFFWDAWIRASQTYAVTNDRILVRTEFPKEWLRTIALRNLPSLTVTTASGSSGSIMFEEAPSNGDRNQPWTSWAPSGSGNGFEFIDNVQRVYDLIVEGQKKAVGRPVPI